MVFINSCHSLPSISAELEDVVQAQLVFRLFVRPARIAQVDLTGFPNSVLSRFRLARLSGGSTQEGNGNIE